MHQQNTQKDFKKKKISVAIGYIVSFALLGMVALDFMGVDMQTSLIARAATYTSPMNNGGQHAASFGSGFWCPHGSGFPQLYQYDVGGRQNAYWYACMN